MSDILKFSWRKYRNFWRSKKMIFNTQLIEEYDSVVNKIFDVICNDWDPLDLSSMEFDDSWKRQEYADCLGQVIKILQSETDDYTIELALVNIVAEMYRCDAENVVRFPEVVKKLLKLGVDLRRLYKLLPKNGNGMLDVSYIRRMESLNKELDEYLRIGEELSRAENSEEN